MASSPAVPNVAGVDWSERWMVPVEEWDQAPEALQALLKHDSRNRCSTGAGKGPRGWFGCESSGQGGYIIWGEWWPPEMLARVAPENCDGDCCYVQNNRGVQERMDKVLQAWEED